MSFIKEAVKLNRELLTSTEKRVYTPWGTPYPANGSASSSSSYSPSSSAAAPGSNFLTLFPSIHSIPRIPSAVSTSLTPGTFTPDLLHEHPLNSVNPTKNKNAHLKHFKSALASPA